MTANSKSARSAKTDKKSTKAAPKKKPTAKKAAKKPAKPQLPSKPLKDSRQEAFAQNVFTQESGMSHGRTRGDAYIDAGYDCKNRGVARRGACQLLTNIDVENRIEWLKEQTANSKILTVVKRKIILSEIANGCLTDFVSISEDGESMSIHLDGESANGRAVKSLSLSTRTSTRKDGESVSETKQTISLVDGVKAIHELNMMEGIHKTGTQDLVDGFSELLNRVSGKGVKPPMEPAEVVG